MFRGRCRSSSSNFGKTATTIPVLDGEPGQELQLDRGWVGWLTLPGKKRRFRAWIFTAVRCGAIAIIKASPTDLLLEFDRAVHEHEPRWFLIRFRIVVICIPSFVSEVLVSVGTTILSGATRDASFVAPCVWKLPDLWPHRTLPTGLCKTADGFAQLPHASSSCSFQKSEEDQNPQESLVTDPQILRRRHFSEVNRTITRADVSLRTDVFPQQIDAVGDAVRIVDDASSEREESFRLDITQYRGRRPPAPALLGEISDAPPTWVAIVPRGAAS